MVKAVQKEESNAWGITSLVTSILGILLILAPYFGLPLSIFAIISAAQQRKVEKTQLSNAGNIMGIIGTVLNAIVLIIVIVLFITIGQEDMLLM